MGKNKKISVIIAAAGTSSRFGKEISKQFVLLDNKPLLIHSLEKFSLLENAVEIVVVTNDTERTKELLKEKCFLDDVKIKIFPGGNLRQDSVYNGFNEVDKSVDLVLIHDVARPLFDLKDVKRCIEEANISGAAILVTPVVDTIKKSRLNKDKLIVENTLDRNFLYQVQTPQVFSYSLLSEAYKNFRSSADLIKVATDEAIMIEHLGKDVNLVIGSRNNIKITFPEDLEIALSILKNAKKVKNELCLN